MYKKAEALQSKTVANRRRKKKLSGLKVKKLGFLFIFWIVLCSVAEHLQGSNHFESSSCSLLTLKLGFLKVQDFLLKT